MSAPAAPAADLDDLYVGEVPVANQSVDARTHALETALGQVLVRVTGDADILQRQDAAGLLSRALDWVQSYGYEKVEKEEAADEIDTVEAIVLPDEIAAIGGVAAEDAAAIETQAVVEKTQLVLRARFDAAAVEHALRNAGLPIWGRERPRTLVFLAIEDEADIVSSETAEDMAGAMIDTAESRGVPLAFPERSGAERGEVRAADIRYGKLEGALAEARHYDVSHVLIGRVRRVGDAWRGEWTLSHRGETVAEWSGAAGEREQILSGATQRLADTYARRFAVYGGAEADTVVAVAVDGVTAVEDYVRIGRYLRGLTSVETAIPVLVDREAVVFRVQLSGDARVLARGIELADWLHEDELARNLAGLYASADNALGYRIGS